MLLHKDAFPPLAGGNAGRFLDFNSVVVAGGE